MIAWFSNWLSRGRHFLFPASRHLGTPLATAQAFEALRASEKLYRAIGESIDYGIWVCDAQGRNLYASESLLKLLGITQQQCSEFGWGDYLHPDDAAATLQAWKQCTLTGKAWYREHRYRGVDGQWHPILACGVPIRDDAGTITHWAGINLDISRLKQAEQSLRDSEAHHRLLAETMLQGVVHQNADGTIISMNPAAEKILGRTREEYIGSNSMREEHGTIREDGSPFPGEEHPAMVSLHTGQPVRGVVMGVYNPRVQAYRWINITAVPLCRPEESKPFEVYTVFDDITERKAAQASLQTKEAILEASLSSMADAVFVTDAQGRFIHFNDAFATYHRFPSKILCSKTFAECPDIFDVFFDDGTPAPVSQWAVPRALRGETATNTEYILRRKDTGETWTGSYSFAPIRNPAGEIVGSVVSARDITERKKTIRDMHAAELKVEKALAASHAKDHFIAILSHELRNPLNPVLLTATMLRENQRLDADTRAQLDIICRNAELEAHLIDDLLDVTRIERGKLLLKRRPVDLQAILRHTLKACQHDIEKQRLTCRVEMEAVPCWVNGDAARLQQVFWNLINNAVKFTPPGGTLNLSCHCATAGVAVIEVQDSGEGISPQLLNHVFNAFEQGDRAITRQFGGLGLGLTICKALVEKHGGTISAYSAGKGMGAMFQVRLPLIAPPAQGDGHAQANPAAECPPIPQSLRILLVEDHADTARVMRQFLDLEGHRVSVAGDQATALTLAAQQPFDLLLSDLGLPDGSGIELLQKLRKQGQSFPSIALSGYGQEQDIQLTRQSGFAAHLTKPVDLQRLRTEMNEVLRAAKA